MGSCIICGTSVDGHICGSHEEDVVFEFEGSRANQLTPGRFYRGSVDGFADFGVFVDIGDSVTGLLHRSELDTRLESLDWDSGETVYVQVTDVHDNGNVDLAWSIRQSPREFRGELVDDPEGDRLAEAEADSESETAEATDPNERAAADSAAEPVTDIASADEPDTDETTGAGTDGDTSVTTDSDDSVNEEDTRTAVPSDEGGAALVESERERVPIADLESRVGDHVRVEGTVVSVRQTGGPTVFELHDESGTVDCAAFEEAGVRAYPDVETDAVVAIEGEVERHRDDLQIETGGLAVLEGEERDAVTTRLEDALAERAAPDAIEPLADDPVIDDLSEEIHDLAGLIRRAVLESRPVVVRHDASVDGYVAGAAIERATLPLVREEHARDDAEYHYFDRRPVEDGIYDMDAATRDVTSMLDANERHDEKFPLFVFCGVGSARSRDGLSLLSIYGAERAAIGDRALDADDLAAHVTPADRDAGTATTATTLAATVASGVNPDVRGDLGNLPAVSYWEGTPEAYADLAAEAGADAERTRDVREAIALVANYQAYEDKRELIADLLFDGSESLAERLATQFREKLDAAIETAEAHLDQREADGVTVAVLDTDAFTHRYDFPPTDLLCDELHRRTREDSPVLLGLGEDELLLRHTGDLDLEAMAEAIAERAPEAGVAARAARDDRIEFLLGERDAVLDAAVTTIGEQFD
ncbi:OB-fold nucleic acid binding domain-containing protein [Halococcus saccharolyticus]|uniref:Putative nuclease/nucleic acid binding OB-fold tRNA/helicase-type n=1 Tax=Halococcus saccharolyticus DSM 5350 TaxID=1227455 RepID=M0MS37_9EURY|nr:OB-fold nucleic acid binding domain-containing protein [Halococcus saccharolyticus]EMA47280.1 putative nuclease/nucleic acid binding OB-fold tRNA/helicase-type [Halococcus saccharolyticus DSM 5350]